MYKYLICLQLFFQIAYSQGEIRKKNVDNNSSIDNIIPKTKDEGLAVFTKTNTSLIPVLSAHQLRNGKADTAQIVFINEGLRSGLFRYNNLNSTSPDDSSLVIRFQNRRYERIFTNITPEYFGADPNDMADDGPALQKALNSATVKGIKIVLSAGTYLSSIQLNPKVVIPAPVYGYKLTIEGAGSGLTSIKALHNLDIINMTQGNQAFAGRQSDIIIKDIHLDGNSLAAHCINLEHIANFKLLDCKISGAIQSNLKIGSEKSENYGIDIIRCYSSGGTVNESHNNAGIELINARYVYIDRFTTDGSKYGIYMIGDKSFITNCHLEGSKVACIYIKGTGGGEHKISNNMFNPYVGYETSAKFEGKIEGLHIEGTSGGSACNIIYGNVFLVPSPSSLPLKFKVSKANMSLRANPGLTITGMSSGAKGKLLGFDPISKRALIDITSGNFKAGEVIKQGSTDGICTLDSFSSSISHAISIIGTSWNNIISNNQIRMNPTVGIYMTGSNNIVSNNSIEAITSIYKDAPFVILTGNILISQNNVALNNVSGEVEASGNKYFGKIIGMTTSENIGFSDDNKKNQSPDLKIGVNSKGQIVAPDMPTSAKGLTSGALWADPEANNVIKLVP